ncbi:TPA: regulator [Providencia alcalifaciens]|nr:regulator [Providencia alcalifaciens]
MRPNITITIPEPFITIDAYCERFNMSRTTVTDMIADGRLPVRRKDKNSKKGRVFINMAKLTVEALSDCDISLNA